jgi:DNA-binding helix-turn-helix protein
MAEFLNLDEITKRLKRIVEQSGLSAKDFALGAGIPQATLSQILNEKQQINVSTINKVIEHYPDLVSPNELLFGETSAAHQGPIASGLFASIGLAETSEKTVDALQATLLAQSEEITRLKSELAQRQAKTIDHITVFFTDNSFMTFHCED